MVTILDSIINIIGGWGGGGAMWPVNEHENFHFENELRYSYELQKLREEQLHPQFGIANHLAFIKIFHDLYERDY